MNSPAEANPSLLPLGLLFFGVLMLVQQVIIFRMRNEHGTAWDSSARWIRIHIGFSVLVSGLCLLISVVMAVAGANDAPWESFYSLWHPDADTRNLLPFLSFMLIVGLGRSAFEQVLENGTKRWIYIRGLCRAVSGRLKWESLPTKVEPRPRPSRDLWLWIFMLMLVLEAGVGVWGKMNSEAGKKHASTEVQPPDPAAASPATAVPPPPANEPSPAAESGPPVAVKDFDKKCYFIGTILILAFAWIGWVYSALFRKLVEEFKFSPTAASRFLGGWASSAPLMQTLVIGSKRSGKTAFCQSGLPTHLKKQLPTETIGTGPETSTQKMWLYPRSWQREPILSISLLDTPGEHLGAQLTAVSNWRADVVVYVIPIDGINWDKLNEIQEKDKHVLAKFNTCFVKPTRPEHILPSWIASGQNFATTVDVIEEAGNFFNSLRRALAQGSNDLAAKELYGVGAFVLFFNCRPTQGNQLLSLPPEHETKLEWIAEELGSRLGVPRERSLMTVGNATNALTTIHFLAEIETFIADKATKKKEEAGDQRAGS